MRPQEWLSPSAGDAIYCNRSLNMQYIKVGIAACGVLEFVSYALSSLFDTDSPRIRAAP